LASLVLVGSGGWSQRWDIAPGQEDAVAAELDKVGSDSVGHVRVLDLETDTEVTLVVAWKYVATVMIVPSPAPEHRPPGHYA